MFPDSLEVLKNFLEFSCSHFTSFKVGKVTRAFRTCFSKLKVMQGNTYGAEQARLENEMVDMVARLARFWSRAGYTERAVALFQALLEINFRAPEFPGFYSLEDKLALFEVRAGFDFSGRLDSSLFDYFFAPFLLSAFLGVGSTSIR